MARLQAAGVEASYVELDSNFGHLASGREADRGRQPCKPS